MNEKLKEFRTSIGKTQIEMAEIWGISLSFYKQIECGIKNPSIKRLKTFKSKFPTADINEIFLAN